MLLVPSAGNSTPFLNIIKIEMYFIWKEIINFTLIVSNLHGDSEVRV